MPSVILVSRTGVEFTVSKPSAFVDAVYSRGAHPKTGTIQANYATLTAGGPPPVESVNEHVTLADLQSGSSPAAVALRAASVAAVQDAIDDGEIVVGGGAEIGTFRPAGSGANPSTNTAGTATGSLAGGTGVKRIHTGPNPVVGLRVKYGNFTIGGAEAHTGYGDITVVAVTIEYPSGTFTPVFFRGDTGGVIKAGAILESDEVALVIPANTDFWVRSYWTWVAGASIPMQGIPIQNGQSSSLSATPTDKTTQVGSVGGDTVGPHPISVLARVPSTAHALAVVGDSIANGSGDFPDQSRGFIDLALDGVLATQKIASPAGLASQNAPQTGRWRKARLVPGCTLALETFGINDLSGSRTLAQIQGDKLTLWAWLKAVPGMRKVYAGTILPNTSSTDGWATTANQTVKAWETTRVQLNDWIRDDAPVNNATALTPVATGTVGALRAGQAGHPLAGHVDLADAIEVNAANVLTRNGGRIKVGTTRSVADAAITSGAKNLTSATAAFVAGDVGKGVTIAGAGSAGALYVGTISSITNGTTAVLSVNAGTTVSGATAVIGTPTTDGLHPTTPGHVLLAAALTAALPAMTA